MKLKPTQTTAFHAELLERDDCHADDLLAYRTFAAKLEKERNAMRVALAPLAEIARIRKLYESGPCNNERHPDSAIICFVEHGRESVTLSLGQCRTAVKLLGRDF